MTPPSRATTPERKRAVIERILAVWLRNPDQRLGQLIHNAWPPDGDTFYAEDEALADAVEQADREWAEADERKRREAARIRPACARKSCRHSFERHRTAAGFCKHCPCQMYMEAAREPECTHDPDDGFALLEEAVCPSCGYPNHEHLAGDCPGPSIA